MNTGDLWQMTYRTRGDVSARAHADSLIVRSDRWWWVKDGTEAAAWTGFGYLLAKVLR